MIGAIDEAKVKAKVNTKDQPQPDLKSQAEPEHAASTHES
jgi:hypothetical protein